MNRTNITFLEGLLEILRRETGGDCGDFFHILPSNPEQKIAYLKTEIIKSLDEIK